ARLGTSRRPAAGQRGGTLTAHPPEGEQNMAVLERGELEASPLADLHAIADQVGLEGFRRLRKADLIDAILGEQTSGAQVPDEDERAAPEREAADADDSEADERGRGGRGSRLRRRRPRRSSADDDEARAEAVDSEAPA